MTGWLVVIVLVSQPSARSKSKPHERIITLGQKGGAALHPRAAELRPRLEVGVQAPAVWCEARPGTPISARNVIPGKVVSIVRGPVTTEVTLEIAPGVQIESTITSTSAKALQLTEGGQAFGIIKASSVMIGVD